MILTHLTNGLVEMTSALRVLKCHSAASTQLPRANSESGNVSTGPWLTQRCRRSVSRCSCCFSRMRTQYPVWACAPLHIQAARHAECGRRCLGVATGLLGIR